MPIVQQTGDRLFPGAPFQTQSEPQIAKMANITRRWVVTGRSVFAGFTYLGQFIAHDLGGRAGLIHRTPALDLDSMYGTPFGVTDLNNPWCPMTNGQFDVGSTTAGRSLDLQRLPSGRAQIPDPRNDENLIVAQFHLLMQRFHNVLIRRVPGTTVQRVEQTRSALTRIFHNIVDQEFIEKVCMASVWKADLELFKLEDGQNLPLEFTHAAMRFGHSMILEHYDINNDVKSEPLLSIFEHTHDGGGLRGNPPVLKDEFVVNWDHFFYLIDTLPAQNAASLDPLVASGMQGLVSFQNIKASFTARLPTGQWIAAKLLELKPDLAQFGLRKELMDAGRNQALLTEYQIDKNTPLWLYLLVEASSPPGEGIRLGPLGSILISDILRSSMSRVEGLMSTADAESLAGEPVRSIRALISYVRARE